VDLVRITDGMNMINQGKTLHFLLYLRTTDQKEFGCPVETGMGDAMLGIWEDRSIVSVVVVVQITRLLDPSSQPQQRHLPPLQGTCSNLFLGLFSF
jgi:hypothetical protein